MVSNSNTDLQSRGPWSWLFLLWLLGFGVLLALDPGADPPLGPSALEGQLLVSARSQAGPVEVPLGEWNPRLISPTQLQVTEWAFRIAGTSLATARRVTMAAVLLVVVLFFFLTRRMAGPRVAFLSAVLLTTNPVFFAVARTALPAAFSLLGMLLVIQLWLWGARSRIAAMLAGALLVWVSLAENGPDNAFFLGAGVLVVILVRLHAWKMTWLRATRERLTAFWVGAGLALLGFLIHILRHSGEFGATWGHFKSVNWHMVAVSMVMAPLYLSEMIQRMPIITGLAVAYFLFFAKEAIRPVARHRRLDDVRLWFLGWILAGSMYFTLTSAPPLNALVLLVPPMCFLAAKCLSNLFWLRTIARPKMDIMIVSLLLACSAWFGSAWFAHAVYSRLDWGGFWAEHAIRGTLILVLGMWIIVAAVLIGGYLKWKHFSVQLRPVPMVFVTGLLLVGILGLGGQRFYRWWGHRTYEVRETAAALDAVLPENALVVGSWAPTLTFGTRARGTLVWPGLNDHGQAWHDDVTHLLLADGNEHRQTAPPLSSFLALGRTVENMEPVAQVGPSRLRLYRIVR